MFKSDRNSLRTIDTSAKLEVALDRWGSDLTTWPSDAGETARRLLDDSSAARELYQKATALDQAFASLAVHRAPPELEHRILASLQRTIASNPANGTAAWLLSLSDWFSGALWRPALAASMPLVFGFVIGVSMPADDVQSFADITEELTLLTFSEPEEALVDAQ